MGFWEHQKEFAGHKIKEYEPGKKLPDPSKSIPRLTVEYESEDTIIELFQSLLGDDNAGRLPALVIGAWDPEEMFEAPPDDLLEALVAAAPQLPNLTALFFGDVTSEECEVSWIQQTDLSPLWSAFPKLEHFRVRGSDGLSLGKMELEHLKSLTIETGGLQKKVVQEVLTAKLPMLEELTLYLGTDSYGANVTVEDLAPLLSGGLFPKLQHLGLCDSYIADKIAQAVADSEIVKRIQSLDLSLGTMGDEGGKALLASPAIAQLKKLDLHHHYMSTEVMKEFKAWKSPKVNLRDQEDEDEYGRYVAVGE